MSLSLIVRVVCKGRVQIPGNVVPVYAYAYSYISCVRSRGRADVCAWICLRQQSWPFIGTTSLLGPYPEWKYVRVRVRVFTRRAQVCARVRHIIAYRTLDRKCISPQHFCSSFSVYEILHSTELLRKFREIVMSFFRKQSTQTCANGFSNIGEFYKIVTLLMSE